MQLRFQSQRFGEDILKTTVVEVPESVCRQLANRVYLERAWLMLALGKRHEPLQIAPGDGGFTGRELKRVFSELSMPMPRISEILCHFQN